MSKILVVIGSGKNGNTGHLAQSFIKGAITSGHDVQKVILDNIQGCIGCQSCQRNGHRCVIHDSMEDIYPLFKEADTIVLASPLYFWSISGRLKSFIDRLYAISINDEYPPKNTILLMTSGSNGFYAFEQAISFYRFYTKALGWLDKGTVLAYGCKKELKHHFINEQYLKEAYDLGKSL